MLPNYFDYIFVHLRQKSRRRPELSSKFVNFKPELGPNPTRKARSDLQLWSLILAPAIPVLGLERVCPRKFGPWSEMFFESLALASKVVSSASPLLITVAF